jgi:hypothetical protein
MFAVTVTWMVTILEWSFEIFFINMGWLIGFRSPKVGIGLRLDGNRELTVHVAVDAKEGYTSTSSNLEAGKMFGEMMIGKALLSMN